MCWNKDISINTFLFGILSLCFIYFANTYTKYKSPTFKNSLVYLFLLSVTSMQLIEYFLWKNINNTKLNELFSMLSALLIVAQQIILILMIPNKNFKYYLFLFYFIFISSYGLYYLIKNGSLFYYKTSIGKNGHLSWEWMNYNGYENIWFFLWMLFYIIPIFMCNSFILSFFLIVTILLSIIYIKQKTFGSMWCWLGNIFFLYFVIDILLIQPFMEYNKLC